MNKFATIDKLTEEYEKRNFLENLIGQLPTQDWLAICHEDGNYCIEKRIDLIEAMHGFIGDDRYNDARGLIDSYHGFTSHKQARLYCLGWMRDWRDEMQSSITELMKLKQYD